eukprot:snap_masked-scaffold_15-processed-gene-2.54-mRNA-1 protein AED:0.78 eAED:1.00 QI:0/0/0/1/1/1/2/0/79
MSFAKALSQVAITMKYAVIFDDMHRPTKVHEIAGFTRELLYMLYPIGMTEKICTCKILVLICIEILFQDNCIEYIVLND